MARDDILNAHGQLQLMQGPDEDRNCKEKERLKLRTRSGSGSKPGSDEQIHSGHFMVSDPHRGKKKDRVGFDFVSANKEPSTSYSFGGNKQCSAKEVDSSFTKLFECLSLAYNGGRIVSPKWKWFRGLKLSTSDKIRLNNAIWREWHMQFRIGLAPVICQFGSPLAETNHNVPEAVILEGKYWKRTPSTVVHEYNKWRVFMMQQKKLAASGKVDKDLNHTNLVKQMKLDVNNEEPMIFEDSFLTDFHDTLFSSLNQPFAFPNPKEIAHMNNSDMIQPGLVQLQPTIESLDDFMDTLEPFQVDLSRSLVQNCSTSPFVFTGCGTSQQSVQGTLNQQPRLDTQSLQLPMNSLDSQQSSMQSLQTNQGLESAMDSIINSELLSNSSSHPLGQSSNTSLYDNVQVNDLGQFQGPYPVQITEALSNTSKDEFTASLVEQFRQEVAQLDELAERQKREKAVQSVAQLLTEQQNVALLNQMTEQRLTLPGEQTIQTVHPSNTLVSMMQPTFTAPQENMQNQQGTILTNTAVQILQQAANQVSQAAEQKPVLTHFMKAPILQPQQPTHPVQFTQPTTSIMLPAVSTHQVLVPFSVSSQPTRRTALLSGDVFAIPKSKAPARRIAPAPPPPTSTSANNVSTTALLSHLLTKDKTSTNFTLAPHAASGIGNNSTTVLVPSSILKTNFSASPTCVVSNSTPTTLFTISTPNMVTSATAATTITPNNSPVSASTTSPLSVITDFSEAHSTRDDDDKEFKKSLTHISAEQKRRFNIKSGFDMLHSLIPSISQNPSSKISKASMLQKGVEYTKKLQLERSQYEQELALLRQEVATLNVSISETQAQLPASGVPVTRQRFDQMKNMFDEYVRERTKHNWKFWIFSIIIRPLFESFNTVVSTSSREELFRTVLSWLDQHCSLLALRPTVLSSLTLLSRTTSILSNPEQMPQQAAKAVNKE